MSESHRFAIVPWPRKLMPRPGAFLLGPTTGIQAPPELAAVAAWFRDQLRPATGLPLPVALKVASGVGVAGSADVVLAIDGALAGDLGGEGYHLVVDPTGVAVHAAAPAGVFHGLQTFRQLLPPENFMGAPARGVAWQAPAVAIEDRPRFGWRGSHLDSARHFQPKDWVLKHLDLMALHKLNVFHWHLTDDQGWRLPVRKYPRLTEVGAWRKDSALGPPPPPDEDGRREWRFRGQPHGGCYTPEDVREVVRYAAERFITVVPEVEMPGHARAAIAAYPALGNTGRSLEVETTWGVFEEIFNVEEPTLRFLQDVLEEVLDLFPSAFIHLGGDEVPKREWRESTAAQARMRALGLRDEDQLQSWFMAQMGAWLAARGRRLVGWDEILQGGLAPGATVMAWQGVEPAITAARQGHDVVMAPMGWTYLDHRQSEDPDEPVSIGGLNTLENAYAFDPLPPGLPPEQAKHILGGQAQLWTEYMPDPRQVEYMAWPRLSAIAEALWSEAQVDGGRSFEDFRRRLQGGHLQRLDHLDVGYRPLAGPRSR
jgi:hexosaminidase